MRGTLGADYDDEKAISILGRQVRWTDRGIEFEADPKHRKLIMEYFAFTENSKSLSNNGEVGQKKEEWREDTLPQNNENKRTILE